jgi:two-component system CheB/CheR fusion protein
MNESQIAALVSENERLKAELNEVRASSNQYLQNVAHQLTAPLGAIKWSIEALKDPQVPIGRKSNLLSSIYSQATILVHLIKNFALMSNLEADLELGQFREKPEPIDMMRLAINLANDFQPQASERGNKIVVAESTFHKVFGSKKLAIEKNLVAQAISNLLENAVKYADSRETINLLAQADDRTVSIVVESKGIPISDEEKRNIFARGFRGAAARQKVAAGTGIGLYLASRVMKLHQGAIHVDAQGRISRFALEFPRPKLK